MIRAGAKWKEAAEDNRGGVLGNKKGGSSMRITENEYENELHGASIVGIRDSIGVSFSSW